MNYILDGYNVIHKSSAFSGLLAKSLEEARRGLIGFCKTLLQSRGDVAKITVVFDGKSDVFSGDESAAGIEIIYTQTGEDADDHIVEYLRKTQPRFATIVSDDNYVCNSARAFKVKSISVAEFVNLRGQKADKSGRKSLNDPSGKQIGLKTRNEITQAYADYLGLKDS